MRAGDVLLTYPVAKPLIKKWEDFAPKPYLCPAAVWSIGYGSTVYPSGRRVSASDHEIDRGFGEILLTVALSHISREIDTLITYEHLTPFMVAAILSLTYNVGVGKHDWIKGDFADSDLLKFLNMGEIAKAADQFLDWCHAHVDGKLVTLPGLLARRQDERTLFLKGVTDAAVAA